MSISATLVLGGILMLEPRVGFGAYLVGQAAACTQGALDGAVQFKQPSFLSA